MSNNGQTSGVRKFIQRPEFSSLVMLVLMVALTAILQNKFFTAKAMVRNINAFAPLILLSMGQGVVIISGGLDLSAGTSLSLYTCILTTVMKQGSSITGLYAFLLTFAVCILVGLVNGIGVGFLRISPVIVTFATSYIWLGIALFLRPTPGGESVEWFRGFYKFGFISNAPEGLVQFGNIIPPALILILLGCAFWYIISKTKTGRYIYAVGGKSDSAYESGINTAVVQTKAYMINSIFIFLAALFFVGQNGSGDARLGDPLTLRAVAAAVVGGIALAGGRGNVFFALVGALILSFVNKIIFFGNIPYAFQTLVGGVIVILAISSSYIYSLYSKRAQVKESKLT